MTTHGTSASDGISDSANSTEVTMRDGNYAKDQRVEDGAQNEDAIQTTGEADVLMNKSNDNFSSAFSSNAKHPDYDDTFSNGQRHGVIDTGIGKGLNYDDTSSQGERHCVIDSDIKELDHDDTFSNTDKHRVIHTDKSKEDDENIDITIKNHNIESDDSATATSTFISPTVKSDDDRNIDKPEDDDYEVTVVRRGPGLSKWQLMKNVLVMSIGFLFLFTSYDALSNLQTSLNKEEGVGAWSIATTYICMMLSGIFLPDLVISVLGCKWTISLSMSVYILFMAANFHAIKALMIPTSVLVGLVAACNWSAQSVYLTQLGVWYGQVTGQKKNDAINFFFGLFFLFLQSGQIWGNLISSLIFAPDTSHNSCNSTTCENATTSIPNTSTIPGNTYHPIASTNASIITSYIKQVSIRTCGAAFCPDDALAEDSSEYFDQSLYKVYILCGTYVALGISGVAILVLFLDNIVLDKEGGNKGRRLSAQRLISTFRHLKTSRVQMLLIPITILCGMENAFISGDFTKAYVSCSLGIWNLGYSLITFGVVGAVCSLAFGRLVRYTGHVPLFVLAFLIDCGALIGMLLWRPSPDQFPVFFVISALWGVGDAVFTSQLCALYGRVFTGNPEVAFGTLKLFDSLGYVICFSYNNYLCTDAKIYIMIAALVIAFLGYAGAELLCRKEERNKETETGHLDDDMDISNKTVEYGAS